MLKCKQITELASQQLDDELSNWQRAEMKLHLWMCKTCSRYVKQLGFIQKLATGIDKQNGNVCLSNEARQRIQEKLKQTQADEKS